MRTKNDGHLTQKDFMEKSRYFTMLCLKRISCIMIHEITPFCFIFPTKAMGEHYGVREILKQLFSISSLLPFLCILCTGLLVYDVRLFNNKFIQTSTIHRNCKYKYFLLSCLFFAFSALVFLSTM